MQLDRRLEDIHQSVLARMRKYEPDWNLLRQADKQRQIEVKGSFGGYYKWLACLVAELQPNHVLEIGNQEGVSTLMMYRELRPNSRITSVDLFPNLSAIPPEVMDDSRVRFVFGNSIDPDLLGSDPPDDVDLCFIDSDHFYDHKLKEWPAVSRYLRSGAIVVCDDIHLNDMDLFWSGLPYEKMDLTHSCHVFGFGFFRYLEMANAST